jgi:hypothetical protein
MNKEQRKLAVLDAIRDDAYELAELWSLERRDGIPEQSARERRAKTCWNSAEGWTSDPRTQ